MKKKLLFALTAAMTITVAFPLTASADEWRNDGKGWWYEIDDDDFDHTEYDDDYDDYAKNGWKLIDKKWYFFDASGYMKTGWIHVDDDWYYLNEDGSLLTNAYTSDGYWVDEEGEWDLRDRDDRYDDDWDDRYDDDRYDDDWDDRYDDDRYDDDWDD